MGGSLTRARRHVAEGGEVAVAVARHSTAAVGAEAKVSQWQAMRAAENGMSLPLWRLLQDPSITDVVISGTRAWADRGSGLTPVTLGLSDEAQTRRLAVGMAAAASQRLDDSQPIVDGVLPGPIRIHAVIPPIAQGGTAISIRVLRPRPFTLEELVETRSLTRKQAQYLRDAVVARKSLLVAGATGVGKTTLLATLLGLVDPRQRLVTIEEVAELSINHPHRVSLQSRVSNVEGEGAVTLEELVRAAMRMRPDRLVLGECRGAEVREVLTALNTGHTGGMATIHANSIADIPARLIALSMLADVDPQTTALLAASAFDLVVFMGRDAAGYRRVERLGTLQLRERTLVGHTFDV